jgi:predicted site-specific integrase-resolvase
MDELDRKTENSAQYIETQKKKLNAKIEEVRNGMEKKLDDIVKQIEDWLKTQKERLTKEFEISVKSKLGII